MKVYEKRRYQERAVEQFKEWIQTDEKFASILLPTGTGKTVCAASCLDGLNKKILWVAHRAELIQQAKDTLDLVVKDKKIEIEMADFKADPNSDIVVGSVQTVSRNRKHFESFKPDLIFIDECHHFSSNNIQYNGLLTRWPEAKILMATATPWRFSGEDLPLGRVLIKMDIGVAVEKGYLVPPVPDTIHTNVSLADVKTKMGDFDTKQLSQAVNVDDRNKLIVDRVIELVKAGRQGIIFAADVDHSKSLHNLLKDKVRAIEIYGDTPTEERTALMQKMRDQQVDVLTNNLIGVEGLDLPHLSFVCVARPTRSLGLWIQMAGRGLRLAPNKKDCIIIDVYDKIKARQSRVTFHDMAVHGDIHGDRRRAVSVLEAPVDKIANKLINFPIFIKPEKEERWQTDDDTFPVTSWSIAPEQWIVTWTREVKTQKTNTKVIWSKFKDVPKNILGTIVLHKDFGDGTVTKIVEHGDNPKAHVVFGWGDERVVLLSHLTYQQSIVEDIPGEFDTRKIDRLFYICMPETEKLGRMLSFDKEGFDLVLKDDKRLSSDEIGAYLHDAAKTDVVLPLVRIAPMARWKNEPASDGQKKFILGLGNKIKFDLDMNNLTKGEASSIIEQNKWQKVIFNKFGTDAKTKLLGYDKEAEDV